MILITKIVDFYTKQLYMMRGVLIRCLWILKVHKKGDLSSRRFFWVLKRFVLFFKVMNLFNKVYRVFFLCVLG